MPDSEKIDTLFSERALKAPGEKYLGGCAHADLYIKHISAKVFCQYVTDIKGNLLKNQEGKKFQKKCPESVFFTIFLCQKAVRGGAEKNFQKKCHESGKMYIIYSRGIKNSAACPAASIYPGGFELKPPSRSG